MASGARGGATESGRVREGGVVSTWVGFPANQSEGKSGSDPPSSLPQVFPDVSDKQGRNRTHGSGKGVLMNDNGQGPGELRYKANEQVTVENLNQDQDVTKGLSSSPNLGVLCLEDVPREVLGFLPGR